MITNRNSIFIVITGIFLIFSVACEENEQTSDSPTSNPEYTGDKNEVNQDAEEIKQPVPSEERKVIAQNLEEPWEIAKVDDIFYISERTGFIVTIEGENKTRKPVQFDESLAEQPESGLLGIAFPDDFKASNRAYAYYSFQRDNENYQRVVTMEETDDQWEETSILLDEIPGGTYHHGGRIKISPDEKLFITIGDASEPDLAQDLENLAGKILRMNLDGSIPEDNPFEGSYVYSYGHRNPQGLSWGPDDKLYATEHGSQALDEMNHITAGSNYGWPIIEGDETAEGMESPLIHSGEETWAPSGMAFYEGNIYFASLRGEALRKFDPINKTQERIVSDVGRVRDVMAAENGVYIITNNTDGRGNPSNEDDQLIFIPIPNNEIQ
ncbi:PQQ-dependent sugar dehydrogenase [Oceanobacillus saliphilus]|uniref:PQQ-dependent sugar dehydrogenase n=1 Tax=Oceanobacillus saliphilus TaxID=2925834 RepID=UPI00201D38DA|nr:PQQ-dependent sugar dehydrogenase [Oceanobacillus saliphilus]